MYYSICLCFISLSTADRVVCASSTSKQPHKCSWVSLLMLAQRTTQLFKRPFFKCGKMCISAHPLRPLLDVRMRASCAVAAHPTHPAQQSTLSARARLPVGTEPGSVRPSLHAPGTSPLFPQVPPQLKQFISAVVGEKGSCFVLGF